MISPTDLLVEVLGLILGVLMAIVAIMVGAIAIASARWAKRSPSHEVKQTRSGA